MGVSLRTELLFLQQSEVSLAAAGWLKLPQAAYFPLFPLGPQSKAYGRRKALGSTKLLRML